MTLRNSLYNFFSKLFLNFVILSTVVTLYSQPSINNFCQKKTHFLKVNKDFIGSNYDLKYIRFNLVVDPDTLFLKGSVTSYFESLQNIDTITFELTKNLIVDSVLHNNQKCNFIHSNDDLLSIYLNNTINSGSIDSVSIYYYGTPAQGSGFGSFVKDYHNGVPIIWTLSQPYGSKDWWPCKNNLTDKIDSVDIIVKSPYPHRTASIGMLLSEKIEQNFITAHWKHKYPIAPYLIAIAVTDYIDYSDYVYFDNDTLEILNYVFPEDIIDIQTKSKGIIPVFKLFDSLFIPYPFLEERYGHAQFLKGGGMEHQTMTFISDFEHNLMTHELAHSWFGNYITCGNWQHIWLNEGFATYLTGLSYENMFNGYWWNIWKSMNIQHVISKPDGSVFCYDTTDVARIFDARLSYNKAALILHSLRWVVGDSAFFAGVNNYLNDANLAYSFAYSDDFISKMGIAADTSLIEFFNDWLYGEGYPIYDINCDILNETNIKIAINQSTSHNSVDLFEMPLPVRFKNYFNDTVIVFNNNTNFQEWTVNLGFIPDSVIFDPDMWIIAKVNSISINNIFLNSNNEIYVFPNPASDKINIYANNSNIINISIFNSLGQELFPEIIINNDNKYYKLNISALSSGMYIVKLKTVSDMFFKKLIVI